MAAKKLVTNKTGSITENTNSLKIGEMSLTILSYMHVFFRRAHLVKKDFSRYKHPRVLCMCFKALESDDRLLCDIDHEISDKT